MPLHACVPAQLGNILFPGRIPQPDLSKYSLEADEDESVPAPAPPKGTEGSSLGNVQGKPRNFLPYAPSWAKHPDYDRVGATSSCAVQLPPLVAWKSGHCRPPLSCIWYGGVVPIEPQLWHGSLGYYNPKTSVQSCCEPARVIMPFLLSRRAQVPQQVCLLAGGVMQHAAVHRCCG